MSTFRKMFSLLFTKRYLLATNTIGSGILMGLGDFTVQQIEKRTGIRPKGAGHHDHDWFRTGRLCAIGVGMGPLLHVWYKFLDRKLPLVAAGSVFRKVILDQTFASPTLIVYFFLGTGLLEGHSFHRSLDELKQKFLVVYLVDLAVWPAAQTINFFLVPPRFRVIYVALLTCAYDMFLSFMKHMDDAAQEFIAHFNGFIFGTSKNEKKQLKKS